MSKIMLLSAMILGGCSFVNQDLTGNQPYEVAFLGDANKITDTYIKAENSTTTDEIESVEEQDCAENEYWDSHFNKCAFYPCCEIKGTWIFVFNDMTTFPWTPITYSAKIAQNKAYVKLELTSTGKLALPKVVNGTLEKTVLHLDGENDSGFLTLDATDVKKQLEADKIKGDYVWLKDDGTNMVGTFYFQR